MTKQDLIALLKRRAYQAGSQTALARELGVSLSYLNDVILGRREPGRAILENLGLERVVSFKKASE